MSKSLRIFALLAAALMLCVFAGCTQPFEEPEDNGEPEPTGAAAEFDRELLGDWYGVFTVSEAAGRFAENAGVTNDCAMRVALGADGKGVCYCVINGLGDGLFENCSAEADGAGLNIKGSIEGGDVDWRFDLLGGVLSLSGLYAVEGDYMRVGFTLRHCGAEWSGSPIPAGYQYTAENGFGGIVALMGGSREKLPEIAEEGVNLRLSEEAQSANAADFNDPGRTVSANGLFSVVLPKGFEVTTDSNTRFEIKNGDTNAVIRYGVEASDKAPMEALLPFMQGGDHDDIFHYSIDGYDCFATVCEGEEGAELVLFGQRDAGELLHIVMNCGLSAEDTVNAVDSLPEFFAQAVLGLLVK